MAIIEYSYDYQKPESTYTLDQFISCQSDSSFCYNNLSFTDQIGNIKYNVYNVLSDYIDEIISEYCVKVTLSDDQLLQYKYRPKLLAYDVYGSQEIYFVLLIINDICSVKEFTRQTIYMPTKEGMSTLCKAVLNANISDIRNYNADNIS